MKNYSTVTNLNREQINYDVLYTNRKTMEIAVFPDCKIIIKAPESASPEEIESRLLKRSRWVRKQLDYFYQFNPRTPRYYIGGESHPYLGRHYKLKIQIGNQSSVKLKDGRFMVTCKDRNSPEIVKGLMDSWYSKKAKDKFTESLFRCIQQFDGAEESAIKLNIRKMKTRWGSLSRGKILTLNVNLIKAPKECLDYVITHELCHLMYRKHDREFYNLLEQIMPDWQTKKHKLETI